MEQFQRLLFSIFKYSHFSYHHFSGGNKTSTIRFIYCGLLKIHRITNTFMKLYPELEKANEFEFSLGILARSLLMDMLLTFDVQKIAKTVNNSNYEETKRKIEECCYNLISDGTESLIDIVEYNKQYSPVEMAEIKKNLRAEFSEVFETNADKLKRKIKRRTVSKIFLDSDNFEFPENEDVYKLYSVYSKYDHLSHWTGVFASMPFVKRKEQIEKCIVLIAFHLRNLLLLAYDFGEDSEILETYIQGLHKELSPFLSKKDI